MNIVLIDDYPPVLKCLTAVLRSAGHAVTPFVDASRALEALAPAVELVVTDVTMPGLDGYGVAAGVARRLGVSLPRTLFISGQATDADLQPLPPSTVIGLVAKPFDIGALGRVMQFLAQTRHDCPGRVGPFCVHGGVLRCADSPEQACPFVGSPDYGRCPWYDAECGRRLRHWITETMRPPQLCP